MAPSSLTRSNSFQEAIQGLIQILLPDLQTFASCDPVTASGLKNCCSSIYHYNLPTILSGLAFKPEAKNAISRKPSLKKSSSQNGEWPSRVSQRHYGHSRSNRAHDSKFGFLHSCTVELCFWSAPPLRFIPTQN